MEQIPDGPKVYRWEGGYQRTWDVIKDAVNDDAQRANESKIEQVYRQIEDRSKRKRLALTQKAGLKLGMLRHLYIIVDFSKSALQQDLKPTRITVILQQTKQFIRNFFDQNPLGNIGIIITKERKANIMTPLSCTPKIHFEMLDNIAAMIKQDRVGVLPDPARPVPDQSGKIFEKIKIKWPFFGVVALFEEMLGQLFVQCSS